MPTTFATWHLSEEMNFVSLQKGWNYCVVSFAIKPGTTAGAIKLTSVLDDDYWMTLTIHWSLGVAK